MLLEVSKGFLVFALGHEGTHTDQADFTLLVRLHSGLAIGLIAELKNALHGLHAASVVAIGIACGGQSDPVLHE